MVKSSVFMTTVALKESNKKKDIFSVFVKHNDFLTRINHVHCNLAKFSSETWHFHQNVIFGKIVNKVDKTSYF